MSDLKYIDGNGRVTNFGFVPWLKLNAWLSSLNGAEWVKESLPMGLNRGDVIMELDNRRRKHSSSIAEGAMKLVAGGNRGYGLDWRSFENDHGFTHLEELLIYQPKEWRTQAREYFYTYRFGLNRKSTNEEKRTLKVVVSYEDDDKFETVEVPIFLSSPVLVTLFHPEIAKSDRYMPLNFLLSYGVEVPPIADGGSFKPLQWSLIEKQILEDLSPLDYFFAFQRGVERYSLDMLQIAAKQSGHSRLPLICELDFCRIIGQRLAKHLLRKEVVSWIFSRGGRGDLSPSRTPLSLILAGPSGIGKTEMAAELAKLLNRPGLEDAFHKVDCGKLRDADEIFGMSGAYQGARQGSGLNNYVVRMSDEPEAIGVVLLDEIEKAKKGVLHGLYQVLDKGEWTDKRLQTGEGAQTQVVSCANIIFVMTTNAADNFLVEKAARSETLYTAQARGGPEAGQKTIGECAMSLESAVRKELQKSYPFTDAFLGRVSSVIPFLPLSNGDPDKNILLGEMLTIAKFFIDKDIDTMRRGGGLMKLTPSVNYKEKNKMAKVIVSHAIPSAGVRSIEKCAKDVLHKELLHDCLLEKGGITRGSSVTFHCDELKKTIGHRAIGQAEISEEEDGESQESLPESDSESSWEVSD